MMKGTRYVALLRGINVGGNNLIRMAALKACFEAGGFADVVTYIQSGNVMFIADAAKPDALAHRLEAAIAETFDYAATVVVCSERQMPRDGGASPARVRDGSGEVSLGRRSS